MPQPASDTLQQSYNDVPYTSFPEPARHPDRLAAIGTLLGLDVAPIETCRVLELACGDGANLVSIAATLPRATLVGFDFAPRPIARAQAMARDLGLDNIRLLQIDLRDVPADLGTFDYIIAHGLYSWVPPQVREHVMPVIARHLAPNGVALTSYNALPGSHVRRVVWDMLRHHTRDIGDKPGKLAAARALLKLVATPAGDDGPTRAALRAEVREAARSSDASLAHDDLSEPNEPFHFHEVMADARSAGLTFLAEARLGAMTAAGLAASVQQALSRLDRLAREQYLDFVRFTRFRESLLCHADAPTQFVLQPSRLRGLHAYPSLEMRRGAASKAALGDAQWTAVQECLLARWPSLVTFDEIDAWRTAHAHAGGPSRPTEQLLAQLFVAGLVDLRTAPVALAVEPGERPSAFAAARWLTRDHEVIPSLYHEALRYADPHARRLLALLDGTRTREDLVAALGGPFAAPGGRTQLDNALTLLASKALLVG